MVWTHLKNIGQIGNLPQIGVKIKNIWNHRPVPLFFDSLPPALHNYPPILRALGVRRDVAIIIQFTQADINAATPEFPIPPCFHTITVRVVIVTASRAESSRGGWLQFVFEANLGWFQSWNRYPLKDLCIVYQYIWLFFMVNVGKYTIHGSGTWILSCFGARWFGIQASWMEGMIKVVGRGHPQDCKPRHFQNVKGLYKPVSCTHGSIGYWSYGHPLLASNLYQRFIQTKEITSHFS